MIRRIAVKKDGTISMSEFRNFAEKYQGEIDKLEEENRKLKLHIEAKDKAYTALLKDYEDLEKKYRTKTKQLEEELNRFKDLRDSGEF